MTSTIARCAGIAPRTGPSWVFRRIPWVVAGIFVMRGLMPGSARYDPTYLEWNRELYRPLALAFAALTIATCLLTARAARESAVAQGARQPL